MRDAVEGVDPTNFLTGASELATLLQSHDWSQTPLGAIETWSDSVKTAVRLLLTELDRAKQLEQAPLALEAALPQECRSAAAQQAAEADAFRGRLTKALRPLTDANEIQAIAARLLGESLGANRVIYIEVLPSGTEVIVHKNYTNGVTELSGLYRLEDFGRNLLADHRAGRTAIVPDVANYPQYTADEAARYRAIEIAAHLDVPLLKNQQFVALLAVHQATPRQWTADEVKRVEETAEQTWAAVERARAEAALRQNEEQSRNILESIAEAFFALDENWRFTYVNRSAEALLDRAPGDLLGKNLWEEYPGLSGNELAQLYWSAMRDRVAASSTAFYPDHERWYEVRTYPAPNGISVYFRNMTEQMQTEAALRESEARFRQVANAAPVLIWISETDKLCYFFNQPWLDFTGRTIEQERGHGWAEGVHPDDYQQCLATYVTAFDARQPFQMEYRLRRFDGEYRWLLDTGVPRFTDEGAFLGYIGSCVDIDDRKQAEVALRESEERYRTLFESIDEGFCVVEVLLNDQETPIDYRILEINPAFEQQTGLRQAVGQTARQLKLEEHWIELYGQVALTGEAVRFENGSKALNRWFDVYACRTDKPEARKVAIVFKNISDHKRAEEILRQAAESNAFRVSLADALRPLADPVEIQAVASRVLGEYLGANRVAYFEVRDANYVVERDYVNGATALAGNYPVASFGLDLLAVYRTGRSVSVPDVAAASNLSPEQRAAYNAIQVGAYIGIPLVKEGEFVAGLAVQTAGSREWTPGEIALAEEVAENTWAAVERARTETALRDSENRFRIAIEAAQLGTWDWNLLTNQLLWDECCKAMFGLPPEAESSIEVFFAGLHPDDRERLEQIVAWTLNPASSGSYDTEYRTIGLQDGIERWLAARGQAYFDAAGKPQRFVGTVLNITEKKRIEAEREQLFARERAAREAADRANQIKDEFLAVLSHELRSPLNPILGWSRLLQQGKLDAAKTKMALTTIERNAQLQVQLIDDLLDISRILQGKLRLHMLPVALSAVIAEALETFRLAAEAKTIHMQTMLSPGVGIVLGDAGRLQQVVWNLLSNAVKFTPHGGQVIIALDADEAYAQIQVTDTGKGIRSDFLPYVFEHFRQEDGATTRKFGGLGLGLAIVRQIVALHGGTVAVASRGEGQGATFTVRLPLTTHSTVVSATEPSPSLVEDLSGIHILVVDDDTDSREFVTFVLEQAGAIVTAVASGVAALQAFSSSVPNLLVSDIGMPDMDGYMLMRQIRSLPLEQGGQIPALALTAYAGEMDQQQALAAGFQQHLAKPIDPTQLAIVVAALAGRTPKPKHKSC